MEKIKQKGFTLIELVITIGIIGLLSSVLVVATLNARIKARDVKRKSSLVQMGRLLFSSSCYAPNSGAGDYDLADLVPELTVKYPQLAQYSSMLPKDPKTGTENKTNYGYVYTSDGHCAVYANFENEKGTVNLSVTTVTPTAGQGVFKATTEGPNGSNIYFQIGK
jgi:prepilin-type N-terminal cleavage/methylation domain-containing protein